MALASVLGVTTPAASTCCEIPDPEVAIESADAAFVGIVSALANEDRWATVFVTEIWRGAGLPQVVEVRGTSSASAGSWVDSDRTYRAGATYLFVIDIEGGVLRDSTCTATTPWNAGLDVLRPASAHAPGFAERAVDAADVGELVVQVLAAAVVGLLLFGGVALASRRRAG